MDVYDRLSNIGTKKCEQTKYKQFISSILSGCFLAFGACCSFRVGGALPNSDIGIQRLISGLFGLPIGLLLIVICNTQLFTGNTAFFTISYCEKKINFLQCIKSLILIYLGNLLGSILFGWMIYGSEILNNNTNIIKLAEDKVSYNWGVTLLKGILCNWFVCLSLWQAASFDTLTDKAVALFFPIAGFVALGLEHSVANMYIIPQGMILGADITVGEFIWNNLIPVTIGNIISGILFVGLPFYFLNTKKISNGPIVTDV
jgi:formate transporter